MPPYLQLAVQGQVVYNWLFYHVPLKRDQGNWDGRLRLNDIPNAIGCTTYSITTWINYNTKSSTVALLRKMTCTWRHPMGLRHPVQRQVIYNLFKYNLFNYNVNPLQGQVIYNWLFYHVPLKRDQGNWDGRLRLNDIPNVHQVQRQVVYNLITYNVKSTTRIQQHPLQLGHLQRYSTTMSIINTNYNLTTYNVNQQLCKSTTTLHQLQFINNTNYNLITYNVN